MAEYSLQLASVSFLLSGSFFFFFHCTTKEGIEARRHEDTQQQQEIGAACSAFLFTVAVSHFASAYACQSPVWERERIHELPKQTNLNADNNKNAFFAN